MFNKDVEQIERLKTFLLVVTILIFSLVFYTVAKMLYEGLFTWEIFILRVVALYLVLVMYWISHKGLTIKQHSYLK